MLCGDECGRGRAGPLGASHGVWGIQGSVYRREGRRWGPWKKLREWLPPYHHTQPPSVPGLTCVVRGADTHVGVDPVHAGGVVLTIVIVTVVWVELTPLPLKAQRARAALGTCGVGRRGPGVREGVG